MSRTERAIDTGPRGRPGPREVEQEHEQRRARGRQAADLREQELRAEYEATGEAIRRAQMRLNARKQELDGVRRELGRVPGPALDAVKRISDGAADAFYNRFVTGSWVGSLALGHSPPPPSELMDLHALAAEGDGVKFADRVSECIARVAADKQHGVLTNRDPKAMETERANTAKAVKKAEQEFEAARQAQAVAGARLATFEMGGKV